MARIPNHSSMVSLKVDNISYRTTIDELKPLFEKYGDIGDIYIPRDKFTRESRGFAFVRFYDKRDAEEAMDRLDGCSVDGRDIRVSRAMHPRPVNRYNSRGGGGGGGGYRGGGGGGGGGGGYGGRDGYSSRRSRSRSRSRGRRRSYSRSRSRERARYSRSPKRNSRSPHSRDRKSDSRSPKRESKSKSRSRSRSRGRN